MGFLVRVWWVGAMPVLFDERLLKGQSFIVIREYMAVLYCFIIAQYIDWLGLGGWLLFLLKILVAEV